MAAGMCAPEFRRDLDLLPTWHKDVARRHAQVPVLAATTLDHVNGSHRKALRQFANLTFCRQAHDTLQRCGLSCGLTRTGDLVLFPGFHNPLRGTATFPRIPEELRGSTMLEGQDCADYYGSLQFCDCPQNPQGTEATCRFVSFDRSMRFDDVGDTVMR